VIDLRQQALAVPRGESRSLALQGAISPVGNSGAWMECRSHRLSGRIRQVMRALRERGTIERTRFHNVLVVKAANPRTFWNG
jgi:hypothetical protein